VALRLGRWAATIIIAGSSVAAIALLALEPNSTRSTSWPPPKRSTPVVSRSWDSSMR